MPRKPGTPCRHPTCPHLKPCPTHPRPPRPGRQARGYDKAHDELREQWRPRVEAGAVDCHADHCIALIRRILPGQAWDLGHNRATGTHRGPEHARCNRSDGGKAAHRHHTQ